MSSRLAVFQQQRTGKNKKTLRQIGLEFGLTPERVRQILAQKESRKCLVHDVFISAKCRWCEHDKHYKQLLSKLKKDHLQKEIERLSNRDRTKETSMERALLVKKLHDEYQMSFRQIGKHLKRDHTTILHLYYLE